MPAQVKQKVHTQAKTVMLSIRDLCHRAGIARFLEP